MPASSRSKCSCALLLHRIQAHSNHHKERMMNSNIPKEIFATTLRRLMVGLILATLIHHLSYHSVMDNKKKDEALGCCCSKKNKLDHLQRLSRRTSRNEAPPILFLHNPKFLLMIHNLKRLRAGSGGGGGSHDNSEEEEEDHMKNILNNDPKNMEFSDPNPPRIKELDWVTQKFKPDPRLPTPYINEFLSDSDVPFNSPFSRQISQILDLDPGPAMEKYVRMQHPTVPIHLHYIKRYLLSLGFDEGILNNTKSLDVRYPERQGKPWVPGWEIEGSHTPIVLQIDDRIFRHEPDVTWDERYGKCCLMMVDLDDSEGFGSTKRKIKAKKKNHHHHRHRHHSDRHQDKEEEEEEEEEEERGGDKKEEEEEDQDHESRDDDDDDDEEKDHYGKKSAKIGKNSPYLHWLLVNAIGSNVNEEGEGGGGGGGGGGELIYRYRGPLRYATGKHRYMFLLFKQNQQHDNDDDYYYQDTVRPPTWPSFQEEEEEERQLDGTAGEWRSNRDRWPLKRFLDANPKLSLVATNFFVYDHRNKSMAKYKMIVGENMEEWEPCDRSTPQMKAKKINKINMFGMDIDSDIAAQYFEDKKRPDLNDLYVDFDQLGDKKTKLERTNDPYDNYWDPRMDKFAQDVDDYLKEEQQP